ncbi:MCE family protein [Actinomycetes bacterium KLBMP 9759]
MIKKRLQGLVFVVVLVAMVALAIGKYAGAFESGVPVTMKVARVGNQLTERADVKVRGLKVGTVEAVTSDGTGATVQMSIQPDKVDLIPANVSARLIPKTLFGEKYVSLVIPEGTRGAPIAAGDVIPQDRSEAAREVERVLDDLLPLLQAVEPQDLATTLGALSQSLEGRGENLGRTLVRLQELTGGLRPAIPDLQADITQLADYSVNLREAAPDLLDALEDFTVTSRTVVDQREELSEFFDSITEASDDLKAFLSDNKENLIGLSASARPTLESLARYAPEFPCLFDQLAGIVPLADKAFGKDTGKPGIHITLEIVNNQGKYVPNRDEPRYEDDRGPRCYPILPLGPQTPPDGPFKNGAQPPPAPEEEPTGDPEELGIVPASFPSDDMGVPNSPAEQKMISELLALHTGSTPEAVPGWSSLLVGPLLRGAEVTLT